MNLTTSEMEWFCNHLGHDVSIDRDYYRLQTGVVELAKVSKLLLASESGQIGKYKGMSLDDIDVTFES